MIRLFALLICVLLVATPATAQNIAIINGQLPTGPNAGKPVNLIITDGKIAAIGAEVEIPVEHEIVDASSGFITLPLFASATQIGLIANGAADSENDSKAKGVASGPGFDPSPAFRPQSETVLLAKADGLGTAMVYPGTSDNVFAGTGFLADLTHQISKVATRQAALFALGNNDLAPFGDSRAAAWSQLREELTTADAEIVRRVQNAEIPLVLQIDGETDIQQALLLKAEMGIDVVIFGGAEAWLFADRLAAAEVPVILDPLDGLPFYHVERRARRDNAAILSRAGVTIAFSVSAQSIYRSWNVAAASRLGAGIAVANGLPYATGLAAITFTPYQIWINERGNRLTVGEPASLVIWSGDPLEPSSFPTAIYNRGIPLEIRTRHDLLRDRYLGEHASQ